MIFAVLVSSLALAIGLAMFDLVIRELQVSSTVEQSQYAIYAADTAAECALYWDFNYTADPYYSAFPDSASDTAALAATGLWCAGQDVTGGGWGTSALTTVVTSARSATTTTAMTVGSVYYAQLTVIKNWNASSMSTSTTIIADGYNTTAITSPNVVERELVVTY